MVLLHGVGLDHTVWDAVVPLLHDRFDVRRPDLPGHGSGVPVPDGVDLAGLAALVAPKVPVGAHVVGFSLGALVAQQLAAEAGRVASLVSVSSVCRRSDDERAAVLARLRAAAADLPASFESSLDRWFQGTDVDPATIARVRAVLQANDPDQFLRCYRVFATGDADVYPLLRRATVPALALTGSDDGGSTPAMAHRLAEALPDCRADVLAGVRHMLPVQAPAELAARLNEFIGDDTHA